MGARYREERGEGRVSLGSRDVERRAASNCHAPCLPVIPRPDLLARRELMVTIFLRDGSAKLPPFVRSKVREGKSRRCLEFFIRRGRV